MKARLPLISVERAVANTTWRRRGRNLATAKVIRTAAVRSRRIGRGFRRARDGEMLDLRWAVAGWFGWR
jgi:hypothetical protein